MFNALVSQEVTREGKRSSAAITFCSSSIVRVRVKEPPNKRPEGEASEAAGGRVKEPPNTRSREIQGQESRRGIRQTEVDHILRGVMP